jgi:ribonuclease Z
MNPPPHPKAPVATGRVARAVARRQRTRHALLHPETLTVVLVGTGGPMPSRRVQSCTAVFAGGQFLLFDAGDGAARRLETLDLPVADLQRIFLTHFHADHFADLGEVIDRSWLNGRRTPLTVSGPTGIAGLVRAFRDAYTPETGYRTAHHGAEMMPPAFAGAAAHDFDPPTAGAPVVYEHGGVVVRAFRANHPPITPNVGYRIEVADRVVVLSGDTTLTGELRAQSTGADLLVADAMAMDLVAQMEAANRSLGNMLLATILADIRDYHMDVTEVGRLAAEAGVKRLALTHITPPLSAPLQVHAWFRRPIRRAYKGDLVIGRDGTRIVVKAGAG